MQFVTEPKRLDILCQRGIQIANGSCGIKHTALLTAKAEIVLFGSSQFGQCGDGKYGPASTLKANFEVNVALKGK